MQAKASGEEAGPSGAAPRGSTAPREACREGRQDERHLVRLASTAPFHDISGDLRPLRQRSKAWERQPATLYQLLSFQES